MPSFAVVIPAYNEEAGIEACVRTVDSALAALENRTSLIVVNDGSSDGTAATLAALAPHHERLVVATHSTNQGYGAGLRTGTVEARLRGFVYVLFMDSDLTNDPRYLSDFAAEMARGADVVKASRYAPGGGVDGVPVWWAAASRLGNAVARLLFGLPVRDCTNGFRAVRTNLLASIDLQENGFAVIMEELYRLRLLAASYAEVPIVLTSRAAGQRVSSFSFGPRAMGTYLKYPLLAVRDRVRSGLWSIL
jgi:dolichol-phosphate mannosyltransferase